MERDLRVWNLKKKKIKKRGRDVGYWKDNRSVPDENGSS
jgi:hypothetical protein